MPVNYKEIAFEQAIEAFLLTEEGGYDSVHSKAFDKESALFPTILLPFIQETQPKAWKAIESFHGKDTESFILKELRLAIDHQGLLDVIRHGFKCFGKRLRVAWFRSPHGMNPEAEKLYKRNKLTITRQLVYSSAHSKSIDVVLSLNGIPVITAELKNPYTGQTVEHAKKQYENDRSPKDRVLSFNKGAFVHFALDPDLAYMATKLEGKDTYFLPFNKGHNHAAGNPPNTDGYRTQYVWEEVLQKDSLMDIIHRFLHLEVEEKELETAKGLKKIRKEKLIFPRYHQLDCVRKLIADTTSEGVGKNYLVHHSAGSGKSNSIAWLAHRLSSLHNEKDEKIFSSIVVITDRVVLDKQLQDTIYQFEHKQGVVQKIEKDSTQLAEAIDARTPIIITTLQKFPFIHEKIGNLKGRTFAVIVDEAHSSQSGETAAEMKSILNKEGIEKRVKEQAEEEDLDAHDLFVLREMEKRGKQNNLSFYAFTATPKYKTEKLFDAPGSDGKPPFHLYSMRQAIEEGFIMDVLKHYTTYKSYYGLIKKIEDDPELDKKKAARALARFLKLHPYSIAQKTEVMIEHFRNKTMHKIGGRAKAMVVTGSRLEAVRYKKSFDKYIAEKGYDDIRTLVAFSGSVEDPDVPDMHYTEVQMNNGIREKELPEKFGTDEFQVLLVAEKYQTGFDQPLLHTMYVDKRLSGIQAVQTLSRLNRVHPGKENTFVLDFVNDEEEIYNSFKPYYERTPFADDVEPRKLYEIQHRLTEYKLFDDTDIEAFFQIYSRPGFKGTEKDHAKLYSVIDPVVERFDTLEEEEQDDFKSTLTSFRNLYGFMSQIIPFQDSDLEKLYIFGRFLLARLPKRDTGGGYEFDDEVSLKYYRLQKVSEGSIDLTDGEADEIKGPDEVGTGRVQEEYVALSELVEILNDRFGTDFTEADQLFFDQLEVEAADNEKLQKAAKANTLEDFKFVFDREFEDLIIGRMEGNEDISTKLLKDQDLREVAMLHMLQNVYKKIRDEESLRY
ncbi:type I restriction endonuclease subunit R [Gracilimonas amylolytica]|uniref:type I restriction endonuclease subunit R n=1 Tax=Gracilimonas amylolytica TaxID=1749045 RepID=UPI000CD9E5C5|nr:DEAD/DEAH box helicase family protein [Gracilimonas amylolytica]